MTHKEAIRYGLNILKVADEAHDKNAIGFVELAIKAISGKHRDRKKAKRYKRKYLKLETALGKIKAELESLKRSEYQNYPENALIYSRCIEIINKYTLVGTGEIYPGEFESEDKE